MKKLLLATVAALAFAGSAHAAVIRNLGVNPASSQGDFANSVGGATFSDDYTFTLSGAPSFISFSSATNVFANTADFITSFQGQLYNDATDLPIGPLATATNCPGTTTGCQILAGSAVLDAGSYFLRLTGIGGGQSGYGGNLTTIGVGEVPIPGLALAVPFGAVGLAWATRRRKRPLAS